MKQPILLLGLSLFLLSATALAMDRTDDPVGRDRTLLDSSEFIIVWGVPGDSVSAKLYDFLPLPVPKPTGETGEIDLKRRQTEMGPWGLHGRGDMDVATGDFDGEGFADVVGVWEGPNRSINVVVPEIAANTLSWDTANRVNLADSIKTQTIDLAVGDFDADWRDEMVVAYVGMDDLIHLQLLDPEGTLTPVPHGAIADESVLPNAANMDRYSLAVSTGDLDGDRDDEIILVGIDNDWDGNGPLEEWGVYAKIYDVTVIAGSMQVQPKGRTIYFKQPYPVNQDPFIFQLVLSMATGDFDQDTIDEIAVLTVTQTDDELGDYDDTFLQILEVSPDLGTIQEVSQGGDARQIFTSNSQPGASVVTGDLTRDGRDEIVYSVNSWVHVFSVEEATQEPDPQHLLTPHFRESYTAVSSGDSDDQYSHTVIGIANMDGAADENPDADFPEIVAVYNNHSSGVGEDQFLEMAVHAMQNTDQASWTAKRRADLEDERGPGGGGGGRRHFAMAMGDFDGDRIRVGDPVITSLTDVRRPLVLLNAPPVHFDVLGGTHYDVNQCFDQGTCGFTATYEQSQTLEVGITTEINSEWQVSVGSGAIAEEAGFKAGATMDVTYGESFKNVESRNTSVTMRTTVVATEDDILYAVVADYNLWEYPVFADGEHIGYLMAVDPIWSGNVWIPSKSPETGADYRPDHEPGNILSYQEYPDSLQQNNNVAVLIRGSNTESFILNDTQNFEWFLKFQDFSESSVQTSWKAGLDVQVEAVVARASGEYQTDEISTNTTKVTEELSLKVNLGQVDLGLGSAQYRVTPYTYWSRNGALVVDYAVRPERALPGEDPTFWDEHYGQEPDPGFLMRWRYDQEKGRSVSDKQKQRTNQITFSKPELVRGELTTITARVHNLSLTDMTGPVAVRFYLEDPDQGGRLIQSPTGESEAVVGPLAARESGLAELEWRVPDGQERFLTVYAKIDPLGQVDEIHENNNKGWTILGINDNLTPVELTRFELRATLGQIILSWTPASGSDHAGFYVWRAPEASPDFERISGRLGPDTREFVDVAVTPGVRYLYRLEGVDRAGRSSFFGPVSGAALGISPRLHLAQNTPNPFAGSTRIRFQTPVGARVQLTVFDINGRLVRRLLDDTHRPGAYETEWDGRDDQGRQVGSGLYLYRLQIPGDSRTGRMVLIR